MKAANAKAIAAEAELVKAPSWSEDRYWHVVADDGTALVVVTPFYRGGRSVGWSFYLKATGPTGYPGPFNNRIAAAVQGLQIWIRYTTD